MKRSLTNVRDFFWRSQSVNKERENPPWQSPANSSDPEKLIGIVSQAKYNFGEYELFRPSKGFDFKIVHFLFINLTLFTMDKTKKTLIWCPDRERERKI